MSPLIDKNEYLTSLDKVNRQNLESVSQAFLAMMEEQDVSGALLAVGGTVRPETRRTPRKDIDIVAFLDGGISFEELKRVAENIQMKTGFSISDFTAPVPDREYGGGILRHVGSVKLQPTDGTPIEITREEHGDLWQKIVERNNNRGYHQVILASRNPTK